MLFEVEFYTTPKGDTPVQEFLDSLDEKTRAKLVSMLELLEEKGNARRYRNELKLRTR